MKAAGRLIFACAIGTLACGCVTERVTKLPGTPVVPLSKGGSAAPTASATPTKAKPDAKGPKTPLPTGPVAEPANGATVATDVLVEVQSFGRVSYDGQALPLCSPDGNYLVIQEGTPPTWATILAEPEAQAPAGARLAIFASTKPPLKSIRPAEPLPAGLILGRAADADGFLVEMPRSLGVRWIGRVSWATGKLTWLVQGSQCSAHAMLDAGGNLLYTRRAASSNTTTLVLRSPDGRESVKEPLDGGYAYPCAVESADTIYAFRLSRIGTELEAIRVDRRDPAAPRLADTRQTWRISSQADALMAHQMASTVEAVWPRSPESLANLGEGEFDVLAAFDPRKSCMARFNWKTGEVEALVGKSIAASAVPLQPRPGYFCTAPEGLVFMPRPTDGWQQTPSENTPQARVLDLPYVARGLKTDLPIYLLIGPAKGQADKIEIVKMAVGAK